jgi:hypothetical protein
MHRYGLSLFNAEIPGIKRPFAERAIIYRKRLWQNSRFSKRAFDALLLSFANRFMFPAEIEYSESELYVICTESILFDCTMAPEYTSAQLVHIPGATPGGKATPG